MDLDEMVDRIGDHVRRCIIVHHADRIKEIVIPGPSSSLAFRVTLDASAGTAKVSAVAVVQRTEVVETLLNSHTYRLDSDSVVEDVLAVIGQ